MRHVKIVTDSTSDVPIEFRQKLGIEQVPLKIHFGDEVFIENVNICAEEFYRRVRQTNQIPSTSAPDLVEFIECYARWADRYNIISIHLSSEFSETYRMALEAGDHVMKQFPECTIQVIDSKSASMGFGLIAVQAAEFAKEGRSISDITDFIYQANLKTYAFFTVGTMTYLRMGGRIGNLRSILPSMIGKKGILTLKEGTVSLLERVDMRIGMDMVDKLFGSIIKTVPSKSEIFSVVLDASAPDKAEQLMERILSRYQCRRYFRSTIGPVVGVHTGIGTFAAVIQSL